MKCCGCRKNFRHPPSTSGKRPSTSTNAAFPAHRLAHQVAAHQLSRAYRLAYRIFAYQSECLGLRGNPLGNRPFGNRPKTAVPVLTPPVNRCLVNHPANARFRGYLVGYRPSNRLFSGHTAQDQKSVGCHRQKKTRLRAGCGVFWCVLVLAVLQPGVATTPPSSPAPHRFRCGRTSRSWP